MIHVFRHVPLQFVERATGLNEHGVEVPVIIKCLRGDQQLSLVTVAVELEDGAWSAGVMTMRRTGSPFADWVDLATPDTITAIDKDKEAYTVDFPYFAIEVTTANASAAYVTITITTSEV